MVIREGVRSRGWPSRSTWPSGTATAWCWPAHEEKTPRRPAVWHDRLFSTQYACPNCKISYEELEPRTFSFNSPYGACPACEGLGSRVAFDPELVLPDAEPLAGRRGDRAVEGRHAGRGAAEAQKQLAALSGQGRHPLEHAAGEACSRSVREQLLHGDGKRFPGVLAMLEKEYATTASEPKRQRLEAFRGEVACAGVRRGPAAARGPQRVRVAGRAIHEVTALTVDGGAGEIFRRPARSPPAPAADRPADPRAKSPPGWSFSITSGWTTSRWTGPADTLSGGELQRVRLAAGLGSGLVGVCYVLDEPSIGLHPRDNQRLIDALGNLQSRGNTVVVVEHDETIMRQADWLVDLGPGAGRHGGRVVAQGTPAAGRPPIRTR